MTDDISKVAREMRDCCNTVGCGGRHGYCDLHQWADRLESAATPAEVGTECAEFVNMVGDEFGNDAGVRLRDLLATLARQLAEARADVARLDTECKDRIRQALENGQAAHEARFERDALRQSVKGLRFDVFSLTTPELQAAFGGKRSIAVVDTDTVTAIRAVLESGA